MTTPPESADADYIISSAQTVAGTTVSAITVIDGARSTLEDWHAVSLVQSTSAEIFHNRESSRTREANLQLPDFAYPDASSYRAEWKRNNINH